jgi:hypothetical protein
MVTGVAVGEYRVDSVREDRHGEMVQREERERGRERTRSEMTKRQSGKEVKHKGRQQFDYTEWYREAEGMQLG